jgi:acetyltransferase
MATPLLINEHSPMSSFFSPASVALIGATDRGGSVGYTVLHNLQQAYKGRIFPVNSKRAEIFGLRCYPSITAIPEPVDLVIIVTPAATVPALVAECVSAAARSIVVISAGFKEKGAEGVALEKEIQAQLRKSSTRLIGPNCLGIMNPWLGLNATFAQDIARPGSVAFLSQSGALLTAILDWSLSEHVGFSAIVSTGSMLDVGWADLLSHFGADDNTRSILLYMESIGDARAFLSAAREVSFGKPIIVIKAGRSEAASKAAASHTGAMTGSDEVYDAAFRRCGVLRVDRISELFQLADVLGKQPRPRGPKLTILTNAGGPGVLATDTLMAIGGELPPLSESATQQLNAFLPPHWSHANPIDILGDSDPERYARATDIALQDPNSDGLLVILAPQGMTDPAKVAEGLKAHAKTHGKPILASWMGGAGVEPGVKILTAAGIPAFDYPDSAVRAFKSMWNYTYNLRGLYETPFSADDPAVVSGRKEKARRLLEAAANSGRTLLTELESKEILKLYGIPTVPTVLAQSENEAAAKAKEIGFPLVLKLHSETITHKTDVGGVQLNLENDRQVREAYRAIESSVAAKAGRAGFQGVTVQPMVRAQGYELILGSTIDAQFGPVILFGSGGQLVEVYRDRALALPPLNTTLAARLMEQTKILKALRGVRGRKPVDLPALETLLVRFSELVVEQPRLREVDINPVLASAEQLLALDARMVLFPAEVQDAQLPRPAIRPYPSQYISHWQMPGANSEKDAGVPKDVSEVGRVAAVKSSNAKGASAASATTEVTIRPIRPEDEPLMVAFHHTLSDASVYLRYFQVQKLDSRIAHENLIRRCCVDYDREIALVVDRINPQSREHEILAVGRLTRPLGRQEAELGVLVTDRHQNAGLGRELVARLIDIARTEKIQTIVAHILTQNTPMLALARRFHFTPTPGRDPNSQTTILHLN